MKPFGSIKATDLVGVTTGPCNNPFYADTKVIFLGIDPGTGNRIYIRIHPDPEVNPAIFAPLALLPGKRVVEYKNIPNSLTPPTRDITYAVRSDFSNHAYAIYDSKVYDACAGPEVGTDNETAYKTKVIDGTPPAGASTTKAFTLK